MDHHDLLRSRALAQRVTTQRYLCPECAPTRRNQRDKPLSLTVKEDDTAVWRCHHCGFQGGLSLKTPVPVVDVHPTKPVPFRLPAPTQNQSPTIESSTPSSVVGHHTRAHNYIFSRGLTQQVAEACNVVYDKRFVGSHIQDAIGFAYRGQETPAVKWRAVNEKSFIQTGSATSLWQIERLKEGDPLIITEGEFDCMAIWQAGLPAVSVPNGAPQFLTPEGTSSPKEDKKYAYLRAEKVVIIAEKASKIIIATDGDTPGQALGEELARRLGRGRCWRVTWPESCKDANDVLLTLGPSALRECVEKAKPWPVKGIYDAMHWVTAVDTLYDNGLIRGKNTGLKELDPLYSIMPGQLCVVTGIPSMGKSALIDQLMVNLAKAEGWRFAVCSFENEPRIHIAKLIQLYHGRPFFSGLLPRISRVEKADGLQWVNEHFTFLYQGDGQQSTMDDILERLRIAVLRYGIRGAVIDPANFIERGNRDISETEWVSDILTKLKVFLMAFDCHVWFVAHPYKLRRGDDGKYAVPGGYEISGSSHWFNKTDFGMTVHRPDLSSNTSEVHIWKCRYNWVGSVGKAVLNYEPATGCFFDPVKAWAPPPPMEKPWEDI